MARNADHIGEAKNGFSGTTKYLGNLNAEIDANGYFVNGNGWGTFSVKGTGCRDQGKDFEGNLVLKIRDYSSVFGKFTCHGSNAFDGMLIKGTFVLNSDGWFDAECEIIDP